MLKIDDWLAERDGFELTGDLVNGRKSLESVKEFKNDCCGVAREDS
jgi:hypothetical protein